MNELEAVKNTLEIERITIISLEKLDNNYIHIIGKKENKKIDVITNGINTFNFSSFSKVKNIISYNYRDYLIAQNIYGEMFLISLNDGVRLIKKVKEINYIDDGLFSVGERERFATERVFDLNTNNYIPFPDNMIFETYKDGVLTLRESDKKSYEQHQEMIIDRSGNIIIPQVKGRFRIIDKTKFMSDNMIIDLNQKVIIQDADLIMPLPGDKCMILKNSKLFILNKYLEVLKIYNIGETKKPWNTLVNGEECIVMTFKKKIKIKKYEPRIEKDITVIVNTKNDTVSKVDFIPSISPYEVFTITDNNNNNKKGLMNKKSEIILNIEYDKIKALHDADNKYFFLEKDENHFIFNSETKDIKEVSYTEMEEFRDGLVLGYTDDPINYQLLDEDLNIVFNLEHMGHTKYYYKNGVLCYHSGSWNNEYDAYTIINQCGDVLMPSRECQVRRNGFELLEIIDKQTGKISFFDMNNSQFVKLEINVPIDKEGKQEYDFSQFSIQQFFLNGKFSLLGEDECEKVKKLIIN